MTDKTLRRAIYPGSFDPVTNGHVSLIERACQLFDEVIVAVATNGGKQPLFDADQRVELMQIAVKELAECERITVVKFDGLTARYASEVKAHAIVRGLRAVSDFEYEFQMALMNRKLSRDIETVFLMPALSWVYLSSSLVKDVALNGGDVADLIPAAVYSIIAEKLKQNA